MFRHRRALVDIGAGMFQQFIDTDRGIADQFDIGTGQFAGAGVRLADGTGEGHGRMRKQRILDLGRVDIMAAANDQVLGPPGDPEIAIGVDPAQIAGAQETVLGEKIVVLVGFGIGRAFEDAGIGHADLAHLVGCAFGKTLGQLPQDAHMGIGQGNADRAHLLDAVDRIATDQTGRLGQAIAFGDLDPGRGLEAVVKLDRQRGRAGNRRPERGDIRVHRPLHQRRDRRRHGNQETDLPAFDQLPEIVEDAIAAIAGGGRHDHMCARGDAAHQHRIGGEDMEQRQRAHQHVGLVEQQCAAQKAVIDHA